MPLTVAQFAARMGLSRQTVYDYIKRGDIVPVRFRDGGAIRIPDKYLEPQQSANREAPIVHQPTFNALNYAPGQLRQLTKAYLQNQEADHGNPDPRR